MAREGLWWFTDPGVIGQKFSAFATDLPEELGNVVSEVLDDAAQTMRETVMTSGVKDGASTGGPRIRTGAMYSSIDSEMSSGRGGRVSGTFGFINDEPDYTVYQEFGTRGGRAGSSAGGGGIKPMLAFAKAQNEIRNELADRVSKINWWKNFR
jgi:hypothetical protein